MNKEEIIKAIEDSLLTKEYLSLDKVKDFNIDCLKAILYATAELCDLSGGISTKKLPDEEEE